MRLAKPILPALVLLISPEVVQAQEAIYLVRHAEQATVGEDPSLTPAGHQRARALADFLRGAGITAIYSSHAQRTRQTAEPVAQALSIPVREVPREQTAALVARIRQDERQGRVLIVGHSETLPQILREFGHAEDLKIDKNDYANLFVVVPNGGAPPTVLRHRTGNSRPAMFDAVAPEAPSTAPQISTEELKAILAGDDAMVLDTRPRGEWAMGHIPGAHSVSPEPGTPMHLYTSDVAEVERLVGGDRTRGIVLYCNGPFCGKSKRTAEALSAAGFRDVRRYQLGAPVWRALGGVMVIEPEGAQRVFAKDGTAVWIDARDPAAFRSGSLPGAVNLPSSGVQPEKDRGEVKCAKNDGRLPMEDHNTRIIVFGSTGAQARAVAEAIAAEAFHNVSYFDGNIEALRAAVAPTAGGSATSSGPAR